MEERNTTFGKALIDFRIHHGLTQKQLAEISGMDNKYISRIERGYTYITALTIEQMSASLDISIKFEPLKGWKITATRK